MYSIERLQEVSGIAQKRVKIFKQYGQDAISVVSHNPYQLAQDV